MKTVRFAKLVAAAGAPTAHALWTAPAQDRAFQRALKEHRVLTIQQENVGTRKDHGLVGFHEQPLAQYVIFPKSIRAFEGQRVIGINYDLLAEPVARPAAAASRAAESETTRDARRHASPKKKFSVNASSAPPVAARDSTEAAKPERVRPSRRSRQVAEEASEAEDGPKKIVAFAPPTPAVETETPGAEQPRSARSGAQRRSAHRASAAEPRGVDPRMIREIERTLKELKAGKAVAAYERLQAVLGEMRAGG